MTAKDLQFLNCHSESLKIDPDYLGSYLINNDFLQEVEFIYRGHKIEMPSEKASLIESLIHLWRKTNRYFELFNLLILYRQYQGEYNSYIDIFSQIITKLKKVNHPPLKTYNVKGIIKCLTFYIDTAYIPLEEVFHVTNKIEGMIEAKDQYEILGSFYSFRYKLDTLLISEPLLARNIAVKVIFNLKERSNSELQLEKWFLRVGSYLVSENIIPQNHNYCRISAEKGSIILTVTVSLTMVLFLIKSITNLRSKIKRDNIMDKFYSITLASFENAIEDTSSSNEKVKIIRSYKEVLTTEKSKQVENMIASLSKEIGGIEKIINHLDIML